MRLGIQVSFTARCHPETNGKNERFNGTLQAEVLRFEHFAGLEACRGAVQRLAQDLQLRAPS